MAVLEYAQRKTGRLKPISWGGWESFPEVLFKVRPENKEMLPRKGSRKSK